MAPRNGVKPRAALWVTLSGLWVTLGGLWVTLSGLWVTLSGLWVTLGAVPPPAPAPRWSPEGRQAMGQKIS